ncbi:MAG TPA: metallophosphoesterase [Erysipelothrix sp.]|nr:metallophosphoesterase [Erysipelothrix sp.]
MFKKFTKRISVLFVAITLSLMSVPFAVHANDEDIITIIHTNDMHGRLAEKVGYNDSNQTFDYTHLSGLKEYAASVNANFILDAGDAIQGKPISNLNKGQYMLDAMLEVGYDAMTIGNHEFDFGHENLSSLRDTYHGKDGFHMVSNNITKNGTDMFDRSVILKNNEHKIAIIGVTTC